MTATLPIAERMPIVGTDIIDTTDERWAMSDAAWYGVASEFAERMLGSGRIEGCTERKKCLVIGSPIPELWKIQANGWGTAYVDCREAPEEVGRSIVADATALPSGDGFYDAVSSTCVTCHAGLGRYGDPIKPNGDLLMLKEIYRVLKSGGRAAICLGPCSDQLRASVVYGNVHRVYKPAEILSEIESIGFVVLDSQLTAAHEPVGAPEIEDDSICVHYSYLSVLLGKP